MTTDPCVTPGCPGDGRYSAPGRGHVAGCRHPVPPADPAVTAAAEAIHRTRCCDNEDEAAWRFYIDHATVAVATARPIIEAEVRERIATEIEEAARLTEETEHDWDITYWVQALHRAARIARRTA